MKMKWKTCRIFHFVFFSEFLWFFFLLWSSTIFLLFDGNTCWNHCFDFVKIFICVVYFNRYIRKKKFSRKITKKSCEFLIFWDFLYKKFNLQRNGYMRNSRIRNGKNLKRCISDRTTQKIYFYVNNFWFNFFSC